MSGRRTGSRLALGALLVVAGCHGPRNPADVDAAGALERGGGAHDEEALAAWRAVGERSCAAAAGEREAKARGEKVKKPADPKDDCGLSKTREAQILERLGRTREAVEVWLSVPSRAASTRHSARALANASRLLAGTLGEPDRAEPIAWRCVERYPDDLGADDCLRTAIGIDKERDARALRDRLDALAARFVKNDLVDNLRFEGAELSVDPIGDTNEAMRRYDALAADYRRSSLRDECLWRGAHLLRDKGDFAGAIERLKKLLATRRRALITGSYNSVYLDDAQLWMGRIYLDDLRDPRRAEEAFAFLADDFKESILRDDALMELARARLAEDDRDGACAAFDRVLGQFPDGNQVRSARRKREELACPAHTATAARGR